jgi:hypothetical protein
MKVCPVCWNEHHAGGVYCSDYCRSLARRQPRRWTRTPGDEPQEERLFELFAPDDDGTFEWLVEHSF